MSLSKKQGIAIGVVCIAIVLAITGWFACRKTSAPATGTSETASSTTVTTVTTVTSVTNVASSTPSAGIQPFPINSADTIASWSFKGAYTGNDVLVVKANTDILNLRSLIGKGQYDDYDLYLGIGNDDDLLGDGAGAYRNYNRSIAIHPNKGLAYTNMGHLMNELGAYHTAADAYAKAVAVEPAVLQYHLARLTFLTQRFPTNNALLSTALADVSKQFGDTAPVLTIEAEWLTSQGRYADAISAWERAKMLSPGKDTSAIDAEIARLKAKQ